MNLGNLNFFKLFIIFIIFIIIFSSKNSYSDNLKGNIVTVGALDKITAKTSTIKLAIGEKKFFGSLEIKGLKCQLSEQNEFMDRLKATTAKHVGDKKDDSDVKASTMAADAPFGPEIRLSAELENQYKNDIEFRKMVNLIRKKK